MARAQWWPGRMMAVVLAGAALSIAVPIGSRASHSLAAVTTRPSNELDADDGDAGGLAGLQERFEAIGRRVSPAVVSISAAEIADDSESAVRAAEMNPQKLQELLNKSTRTIGSGFIIAPNGFILTNEHVIEDSQQFWVTTDDHKVYPAIVIGADPRADLAVMKIPASNLPTVRFAAAPCQRGQWAITLGNPFGLATEGQMALSIGVISATDRSLPKLASKEDRLYSNLIQTTAQINPGNSGGPLIDIDGDVTGIDTAVILPQKQTNGIGFAIPITQSLLDEVSELEAGREIVYAYVGVTVTMPTERQCQDAGLGKPMGVFVETVDTRSPAAKTDGLRNGDILLKVNDNPVEDTDQFARLIGGATVGKPAMFSIIRGQKPMTARVTPTKRPVQYVITNQNQRLFWRGMELGPVPMNWPMAAKDPKALSGILVIGIQDDSPMKKQGLSPGSVITGIAGRPVATMTQLQQILNDIPPEQCTVQTAGSTTEVADVKR